RAAARHAPADAAQVRAPRPGAADAHGRQHARLFGGRARAAPPHQAPGRRSRREPGRSSTVTGDSRVGAAPAAARARRARAPGHAEASGTRDRANRADGRAVESRATGTGRSADLEGQHWTSRTTTP